MSDTFWVAGQAIAGALAFGAVTWQAVLIRKTNAVSQRALAVTQQALIASQAVAIDAARARLDAQAPAVTVRLTDVAWPPHGASQFGVIAGEWPAGQTWHFPVDQDQRIVLQARVVLENGADRHVFVECDGDFIREIEGRPRPVDPFALWPNQKVIVNPNLFLQGDFTIKELSENYEARQAGRPLPHRVIGTVSVHDSRDNGVTDTWEIALTGCPVRPDEDRDGVWVVDTDQGLGSLEFKSHPTYQRTYWLSRQRQERLPDPSYESGDFGSDRALP